MRVITQKKMIKKLAKFNIVPLILALISPLFLPVDPAVAIICGFLLSLIFILSSAWVLDNFWNADSKPVSTCVSGDGNFTWTDKN